jgi:hypothetical protein
MRWSLLQENAAHVFGEAWYLLLFLLPLYVVSWRFVCGHESLVQWTQKRRRFLQIMIALALSSPVVLLLLAVVWRRPYQVDIETLVPTIPPPEFLPPIPPEEVVPMRMRTCVAVVVLGVVAFGFALGAARGRRFVMLGIGLGLIFVISIAWFHSAFAVTGAWI